MKSHISESSYIFKMDGENMAFCLKNQIKTSYIMYIKGGVS